MRLLRPGMGGGKAVVGIEITGLATQGMERARRCMACVARHASLSSAPARWGAPAVPRSPCAQSTPPPARLGPSPDARYLRWAAAQGYRATVMERMAGEEAGVKSVELLIEGRFAYGFLKGAPPCFPRLPWVGDHGDLFSGRWMAGRDLRGLPGRAPCIEGGACGSKGGGSSGGGSKRSCPAPGHTRGPAMRPQLGWGCALCRWRHRLTANPHLPRQLRWASSPPTPGRREGHAPPRPLEPLQRQGPPPDVVRGGRGDAAAGRGRGRAQAGHPRQVRGAGGWDVSHPPHPPTPRTHTLVPQKHAPASRNTHTQGAGCHYHAPAHTQRLALVLVPPSTGAWGSPQCNPARTGTLCNALTPHKGTWRSPRCGLAARGDRT